MTSTLLQDIDLTNVNTALELFSLDQELGRYASNVKVYEFSSMLENNSYPITDLTDFKSKADLVLLHTGFEKRKSLLIKSACQAATKLNEGGSLYLLGSKNEGVQSIAKQLSTIFFASPETISMQKGVRLVKITPTNNFLSQSNNVDNEERTIDSTSVNGIEIKLFREDNVFAKGKVDQASLLLLTNLQVSDNNNILDLGCGAGILGIVASKMAKDTKVTLVDNDYISTETTQKNLVLNRVTNGEVIVSNSTSAIADRKFDIVISNPPFHKGRDVSLDIAEKFIWDGSKSLVSGGSMYVVCNVFLPYEKTMKKVFGNAKIIANDNSFKVITSIKE